MRPGILEPAGKVQFSCGEDQDGLSGLGHVEPSSLAGSLRAHGQLGPHDGVQFHLEMLLHGLLPFLDLCNL